MQLQALSLVIRDEGLSEKPTEFGSITFHRTSANDPLNTQTRWVIQPRDVKGSGPGYEALVFSADTSAADNVVHRQVLIKAEHTAPADGKGSGELISNKVGGVRLCLGPYSPAHLSHGPNTSSLALTFSHRFGLQLSGSLSGALTGPITITGSLTVKDGLVGACLMPPLGLHDIK